MGINFWNDSLKKVGDITCNKKASIMVKREPHLLNIAISDPTMENEGLITIEINASVESPSVLDSRIKIIQLKPVLKFNVNVKDAMGQTIEIFFPMK